MPYKMRKIDANKLFQMNEALASLLQEGKLDEADKLDEEMMQYVGTNGRVVINQVIAPPRLMYMYAFNRAMLQMNHSWVQEAVLSMIDVMETLYFGRVQEDIYFVFDMLAELRGRRNQHYQPFELACDSLLMATLCTRRFPSIALSFFWKTRTLFKETGLEDLKDFTDTFIRTQYELLSIQYGKLDPEGAAMFKEAASNITAVCKIPARETVHRPNLVPIERTHFGQLKKEEELQKESAFKDCDYHVITYEEVEHIAKLYPEFDSKQSMVTKLLGKLDESCLEKLPNILEVLEVVCYDEERYGVLYDRTSPFAKLGIGAHDADGKIETVVNPEGKYVYLTQGLVKNLFYRGQTRKYNPCYASFYRNLSKKQQFVELLKMCEFAILLHKHPSSSLFDIGLSNHLGNGKDEHRSLHIDDEAMAQHYGIKTPYLDVTSDKWVAAFFACCDYKSNPEGERDIYEKHTKEEVGVFYVYQCNPVFAPDGIFRPIGMQPQSRPVRQAGYVRKLEEKEDFNNVATAIPFRYHSGCTSILYWLFDQSGQIQPSEVIELKAKRIVAEEHCFSEVAYQLVHRKYFSELSDEEFEAMVDDYQLKNQADPIVDFTSEELRQCEEERKMIEPYLRFNTRTEQIIIMPFDA